jgi:Repeat of unknown function (DUF5907)
MRSKHLLAVAIFLIGVPSLSLAATAASGNSTAAIATGIPSGPSLPSKCDPGSSKTFLRTTGPGAGLYECTSRNTWTLLSAATTARAHSAGSSRAQNGGELQSLLVARAAPAPNPEPALAPGNPAPAPASSQAGTGRCPSSQFVTAVNPGAPPTCTQPGFSDLSGSAAPTQLPAATATSPGTLQLAGDLAGPSGAPKVAGLQGKPVSTATPTANQVLTWSGSAWAPATPFSSAGGTVTSVGLVAPPEFSVSGSPITASGSLTLTKVGQNANSFYAGPSTGVAAAPAFRSIVPADLPLASSAGAGAVQLSQDLGGSGTAPVVAGIQGNPVASTTPAVNQVLTWNGSAWVPANPSGGGGGTVSSVGLALPAQFAVTGSPVTSSGALSVSWNNYNANTILAGPASGDAAAPTFRPLVPADLPPATGTAPGAVQLSQDLAGSAAAPTVAGLQGQPVASTLPSANQVLSWNGSQWTPAQPSFSNLSGTATPGQLPAATASAQGVLQLAGDLGGSSGIPRVAALQGSPVSSTAPSANQVLTYNGSAWAPATPSAGAGLGSCPSNQYVTATTSGTPTCAQPAFSGLAGTVGSAQLPAASSSAQGALQLAGDFGGTAAAPQVLSTHLASPLTTAQGGSGAGTFTAHGVLLGEGTSAFSVAGPGSSGQCLLSNGSSADPSFAACPSSAATAGGSNTQFEFNNAGSFGGTSNLTYASSTGAVTLNQLANGNETLYGTRTSDVAPSGNFIHFQNYARTADLFKVDTSGNVTAASFTSTASGPFVMSGTEGTCSGAAAGKDVLCLGDTSTHTAQLALNGGSFVPIPQLAGDLGGTAAAPKLASIQGTPVASTVPAANQVLTYNGSAWAPATPSAGAGLGSCPSNQYVTATTSGTPTCAQPTFTDLTGSATPAQLPAASASAQGALQLAGDFGGTAAAPQVLSTHLASPLTTAQGGSGAGTFTAHGVLLGEGTSAFSLAGPGTSGQCLISNGSSADPSFAACPSSAATAGGSNTQFEFNNAGSFGGTSNLTYASSTGAVTLNQLANGNETLYGTRTSDVAPSGNLIHFQNYARTADLFKVDTSGNVTAASFTSTASGPFLMSGTEGSCSGAAAGKDVLCLGDTGSHTAQLALNGGSFVPIPQLAGDLGGTGAAPQVVSTHLASPLTTAQGGSGAGTFAAHGVLLGEGSSAFSAAGPGTSGQCLLSNGSSADPSFAACPTGAATAGGSNTQFEFNNAGSFGGTSNLTYASSTGAVTLNQLANGNETLYGTRTTDTSPTGNLIHFQNYGKTADLFKVDTSGNVTAASFTSTASGPFVMSGTEGSCSGAAAGKDVLCLGDTSSHTARLALNGGSFVPIPQLAGDLGGTAAAPQVVSTHLGHLNQTAANGDVAGAIALSAATSGSHTFAMAFNSAPVCVLTPTSDPGSGLRYWVTATATQITANVSSAMTITFNYHCTGNPN